MGIHTGKRRWVRAAGMALVAAGAISVAGACDDLGVGGEDGGGGNQQEDGGGEEGGEEGGEGGEEGGDEG